METQVCERLIKKNFAFSFSYLILWNTLNHASFHGHNLPLQMRPLHCLEMSGASHPVTQHQKNRTSLQSDYQTLCHPYTAEPEREIMH